MKLYLAPYAPNPRRVAMFLAEKGISDIPIETVDLPSGAHRTPEYRQKSPLSQVPTLELDDGRCLTESRAICTYLEGLHPEPNLMGRDGAERAFIEMWDRRMELSLALPLMMWVRHGHPALAVIERNQTPGVAEFYQKAAERMVAWLDTQLQDKPWVAGDRFTIADITAVAGMDFAKMMKWRPSEELAHVRAWRARVQERPCGQVAP